MIGFTALLYSLLMFFGFRVGFKRSQRGIHGIFSSMNGNKRNMYRTQSCFIEKQQYNFTSWSLIGNRAAIPCYHGNIFS